MITFPVPQRWDYRTPVVIRYLDRRYVDDFFETGRLRLSSFVQFSKHADEPRRDGDEGLIQHTVIGKRHALFAVTRQGRDALVLCGSTRENPHLMRQFECDSYFRITDTTAFALALGTRIPGFIAGLEGHCHYVEHRLVRRRVSFDPTDAIAGSDATHLDMDKFRALLGRATDDPDVYLLKHPRYSYQSEYRIVWHLDRAAPDWLDVECPQAVQFCERPG